jgi:hypothetical protein
VALSRAVAVTQRDGPEQGPAALEAIVGLERSHLWHAALADNLRRPGRIAEAGEERVRGHLPQDRGGSRNGDLDRPLDSGRVGLLTSSASGKAKRLRNNPSATLLPSDVRSRVKADTTPMTGTVELVTSGTDFAAITSRTKAKYGRMVPIMRLVDGLRHLGKGPYPYGDTGVVITLQG